MMLDLPTQHVSSFDLDLFEMGGLDDAKKRVVDEHLRACATCREDHESLKKLRAEFSEKVLPRTVDRVRERIESPARSPFARPAVFAPLLASAAALVLWVAAGHPGFSGEGDAIRAKGGAALDLVARHEGQVFTLDRSHASAASGDEIRFVVTAADLSRPYLFIASVDGRGHANFYFPFDGAESVRVDHAGRWEIPESIVLDDAPGPERFFAVFSREPLAKATLAAALAKIGNGGWDAIRKAERLELADTEQTSSFVEKSVPRP
jgi:hypothetical protein